MHGYLITLFILPVLILCQCHILYGQADNEIQVYASPTIQKGSTIIELHSSYTFNGPPVVVDQKLTRWEYETLEITHGIGKNFEIGFYTFTGFNPTGGYQYLGNQIRPRVTAPQEWNWPVGVSLSGEFGFYRPDPDSSFFSQGEIRPIVDKTMANWYVSFNPNLELVMSGTDKGIEFAPQIKIVYTIMGKFGFGIEYYGALGQLDNFVRYQLQEHLIGPMFDLYTNPRLELNTGFLFGLTDNSNQHIFKLILGWRFLR